MNNASLFRLLSKLNIDKETLIQYLEENYTLKEKSYKQKIAHDDLCRSPFYHNNENSFPNHEKKQQPIQQQPKPQQPIPLYGVGQYNNRCVVCNEFINAPIPCFYTTVQLHGKSATYHSEKAGCFDPAWKIPGSQYDLRKDLRSDKLQTYNRKVRAEKKL